MLVRRMDSLISKRWEYNDFTYPQSGFLLKDHKLTLSKIGDIKIKIHRPIGGAVKKLTVRRHPSEKWFAYFVADVGTPFVSSLAFGDVTGISFGTEFITLSDGEHIEGRQYSASNDRAFVRAQRKLSNATKYTPEWNKALQINQRIREREFNRESNFLHRLSRELVDRYNVIVFEEPNPRYNQRFITPIADDLLIRFTSYKAELAGKVVVRVDSSHAYRMCSRCGMINNTNPTDQQLYHCHCGLVLDWYQNAAINTLRLGLQSLAKDEAGLEVLHHPVQEAATYRTLEQANT